MTWDGETKYHHRLPYCWQADGHHASAGRALRAGAVNARRPLVIARSKRSGEH
jgi:hypothetical protein